MRIRRLSLELGDSPGANVHNLAAPAFVWTVWGMMTAAVFLLIHQYARNAPFMDDFELVPMMTGRQPVSLSWLWAQHNEHRPLISRLILAALYRFGTPDFRLGLYFNAALLSTAALSMILLVRRLRGRSSFTDAVLPLSILCMGQAETLFISFALNLVLTAWISYELIAVAAVGDDRLSGWRTLKLGALLVALPLCGGSGLIMLPPLVLWLALYAIRGCWTGRSLAIMNRVAISLILVACLAVAALYVKDYTSPPKDGPPASISAIVATTLQYLSLVVFPNVSRYWRLAAWVVVSLVTATLVQLTIIARRQPAERLRALGLIAIILSMLITAAAVGWSRAFLGEGMGLVSRYVTISAPLLCVIYCAWLIYGRGSGRRIVHLTLFLMVSISVPANFAYSQRKGAKRLRVYEKLAHQIASRAPLSELMTSVCPSMYPHPEFASRCLGMLRDARIGCFKDLQPFDRLDFALRMSDRPNVESPSSLVFRRTGSDPGFVEKEPLEGASGLVQDRLRSR
jgi:hypothetical protein